MAYRSSPNSYFKKLPNLDYPSLQNDRTSAYDYQIVKNTNGILRVPPKCDSAESLFLT